MRITKLDDKTRGWFVGDFEGATHKCKDFEVAIKKYVAGDYESKHIHKIATEISLVVIGKVEMNGAEYTTNDIIIMEPGDATDFKALTDTMMCVVKIPSVMGDKYVLNS